MKSKMNFSSHSAFLWKRGKIISELFPFFSVVTIWTRKATAGSGIMCWWKLYSIKITGNSALRLDKFLKVHSKWWSCTWLAFLVPFWGKSQCCTAWCLWSEWKHVEANESSCQILHSAVGRTAGLHSSKASLTVTTSVFSKLKMMTFPHGRSHWCCDSLWWERGAWSLPTWFSSYSEFIGSITFKIPHASEGLIFRRIKSL